MIEQIRRDYPVSLSSEAKFADCLEGRLSATNTALDEIILSISDLQPFPQWLAKHWDEVQSRDNVAAYSGRVARRLLRRNRRANGCDMGIGER